jgi:beta-glucuronidase
MYIPIRRIVRSVTTAYLLVLAASAYSQEPLITNISARKTTSLNGQWQYIMDPYETGFYGYRWLERNANDKEAYWNTDVPENKTDRKEHGYTNKQTLRVPGDWNSQAEKFLYYEGTVWYKRTFNYKKQNPGNLLYLYFGAANYKTDVYLNGRKLGSHKGGFTAFNFAIPDSLLKATDNWLVVKVDNKRYKDEIPTLNTDWWNYGGITRDVFLAELPQRFILDYSLRLKKNTINEVEGWVRFNTTVRDNIVLEIPEMDWKKAMTVNGDSISFTAILQGLELWSPEKPKLYKIKISSSENEITDKIGFRNIEVKGSSIVLNGQPVFLRGICIHEEVPQQGRRAYSAADARQLLLQAKSLSANMVRLAHYPHNENMTRVADSLGILVWSEIPVYWTIEFTNPEVLAKAKVQLNEMITRDRNRASIIIWSVGNETPVHEARTAFMKELLITARQLDGSRLVSAALEVHSQNGVSHVDDPLGEFTDIVAVNEYLGWYAGLPSGIKNVQWDIKYDKPLFISETGAEALSGFHGDSLTRWSEEYQEWYYKEQVAMLKRLPPNFSGISPWILNDFRSPRRNNPVYQQGWNNKGLLDHQGRKKKAFFVLKKYYDEIKLTGK